jgi:hypothetical protein
LNCWEYPATNVLAFLEAPLLRTVILNDLSLNVVLPWPQLTSLTLFGVYPRQCVTILQKTSNLVYCKLVVYFDSDGQPRPDIALPYLESLSIDQYDATPVTDFLKTFIVPALRSLKTREEILGASPIESLTVFISKSGCKLEEVHITRRCSLPQDSYRKAFPLIHRFSFDEGDNSSDSGSSNVEHNSDSE